MAMVVCAGALRAGRDPGLGDDQLRRAARRARGHGAASTDFSCGDGHTVATRQRRVAPRSPSRHDLVRRVADQKRSELPLDGDSERQGPAHRESDEALPDGRRGAARRLPRRRGRGVLRAAGPERGRQVDADPLRDRARAADVRGDPRVRPRRDRRLRRGPPGRRAGAAGAEPRLVPDRRGDARLPRRLFRDAQARAPRARRGADRDVLAHGEARRAHAHAVRRDEAAADPGPRPDAPAATADPRRAHRRRRHRAAARALALRASASTRRGRRSCSRRTTWKRPISSATRSPSSTRVEIIAQGSSAELAATYGVANLEDAYLALVGRKELSRSRVEELAS